MVHLLENYKIIVIEEVNNMFITSNKFHKKDPEFLRLVDFLNRYGHNWTKRDIKAISAKYFRLLLENNKVFWTSADKHWDSYEYLTDTDFREAVKEQAQNKLLEGSPMIKDLTSRVENLEQLVENHRQQLFQYRHAILDLKSQKGDKDVD